MASIVLYRPGVATAAAVPLALAFVGGLFGAIVLSAGVRTVATVLVAAALGALATACLALFVGVRRLRLEVAPDRVVVTNLSTRRVVRWSEIARVEATNEWWALAVVAAGATVSDTLAEAPITFPRGVRLYLHDGRQMKVTAVLCADPNRSRQLQHTLVALRREASAHGVPVGY